VLGINGTENRVKDVGQVTVHLSRDILQGIRRIPQRPKFTIESGTENAYRPRRLM